MKTMISSTQTTAHNETLSFGQHVTSQSTHQDVSAAFLFLFCLICFI